MSAGPQSADCHCLVPDLPDQGPVISGTLPRYKKGDLISANCSSISSVPAAKLNWYINGEEATDNMLVPFPPVQDSKGALSSVLGLRLRVKEKTFSKTGDIKIKCTATIQTIYWKSNEESIQGHRDTNSFFTYDTSFWNSGQPQDKMHCNIHKSCFSCPSYC